MTSFHVSDDGGQDEERESFFQFRVRAKQYASLDSYDSYETFWVSKAATIINVFLIQKHLWQPEVGLHSLRQER